MRTTSSIRGVTRVLVVLALVLASACTNGSVAKDNSDPLQRKAAALTDLLAQNEWSTVREDFDPTMRDQLSEAALAAAWQQVTQAKGAYRSRGEPRRVQKPGSFFVFDTPMQFDKGPMKSRITFRSNSEVAGLFILVPEAA